MQRALIPIALILVAGGAWFLLRDDGGRSTQVPDGAPGSTSVQTDAPTVSGAPPPKQPRSAAAETDVPPPPPEDAGVKDAEPPDGPREYSLGIHTVSLRNSKKRIRLETVITVDNPVTLREVRSKRRKLVRMMYFLSAHRAEDGMLAAGGKARFLADLRERYGNVIRTGDLGKVEFRQYEVVDAPAAPASEDKPE
jgi:hypothetical protein